MFKKDFLLRLIEEFFKVLSKLIRYIKTGRLGEAEELVNFAYRKYLKIEPEIVYGAKSDELIDLLKEEYHYELEHFKILAPLLYEEGNLFFEQGKKSEGIAHYHKALVLFHYLNDEDTEVFSFDRAIKMERIEKVLKEIKIQNEEHEE